MMSRMHLTITSIVTALAFLNPTASLGQVCLDSARLGDQIIVRITPGASLEDFLTEFAARHPAIGMLPLDKIAGRTIHLLGLQLPVGFSQADLDLLEDELETTYTTLTWGEMLYETETPEGSTGSTMVDRPALSALFEGQYAAEKIGLSTPLGLTAGTNPVHARSTGLGVVVAVLDTGMDTSHAMLALCIASGGFDFVDQDDDPSDLPDGIDNDLDGLTDEMAGHGTFVAGLIRLVAPDAKLLPVRVLDSDGRGDVWMLAKGLFYAIDRGVEVINVSIGTTYRSAAVEEAADLAQSLGIPLIAAAGNCNREQPPTYPGMGSSGLAIAAVDMDDVKGAFSNFGNRIFISAPGVSDGLTTEPDPTRSIISIIPGDRYAYWEGTSMATPLAAGVAALVRSQHPEWQSVEPTFDQLSFILESTADTIDAVNPAYAGLLGSGRLNALAAVQVGPVAPTLGDLDANGVVGVFDLIRLLSDWGKVHTSSDLNGDGMVNVSDLLQLLGNWG